MGSSRPVTPEDSPQFSSFHHYNINKMSDKQAEREKKQAEVRARLEATTAQGRKKKGFMTPERKKKLRLLLRKNAAEALKKEQEEKAKLRQEMIEQRCGKPKSREGLGENELRSLCNEYQEKICQIESDKYDLEHEVEFKDYQINELNIAVNDLRGKFIKPSLKKVSKYENKFAKLRKKSAKFNFRNQLKTVKKKEFTLEEDDKEQEKKPDWVLGEKEGKTKSTSEAPPEEATADAPEAMVDDAIEA